MFFARVAATFRAFDLVSLEIQKLYTAFDLNA